MNDYFLKIYNVIQKFQLDLYLTHVRDCIETSAFIKYNFKTHGMIKDIFKYENEFQNEINDKVWLEAKNGFISICIPKDKPSNYSINEILESDFYNSNPALLKIALGETPDGGMAVGDVERFINILIGGVPGSGKSNLINVIINCLIQNDTSILNLVLFDLKQVELTQYKNIPHLLKPVITDLNIVKTELLSLIMEMKRRYEILEKSGCRNIQKYNSKIGGMSYLIVIIDELAEIILNKETKSCEEQIIRLAQKGRACGIYLIIATQKPNIDIVTPLIKGSMDTRISFHVASHYDSQVILDQSGAEKLGKCGDMYLRDEDGLQRIQCCYISDEEIEENLKQFEYQEVNHGFGKVDIPQEEIKQIDYIEADFEEVIQDDLSEFDRLYNQAINYVKTNKKCNQWQLRQELHKGIDFVDSILKKLKDDGIIGSYKVGNYYEYKG